MHGDIKDMKLIVINEDRTANSDFNQDNAFIVMLTVPCFIVSSYLSELVVCVNTRDHQGSCGSRSTQILL